MKIVSGCISVLFALAIVGLLFFAGCASVTRSLSEWRQSANLVRVVQIQETQATKRTAIIVDGNVEIARIQADTTKKTDVTFVLFYVVRAATWATGVLWLLIVVKAVKQWTSNN